MDQLVVLIEDDKTGGERVNALFQTSFFLALSQVALVIGTNEPEQHQSDERDDDARRRQQGQGRPSVLWQNGDGPRHVPGMKIKDIGIKPKHILIAQPAEPVHKETDTVV